LPVVSLELGVCLSGTKGRATLSVYTDRGNREQSGLNAIEDERCEVAHKPVLHARSKYEHGKECAVRASPVHGPSQTRTCTDPWRSLRVAGVKLSPAWKQGGYHRLSCGAPVTISTLAGPGSKEALVLPTLYAVDDLCAYVRVALMLD
jgi:hypothetical protein